MNQFYKIIIVSGLAFAAYYPTATPPTAPEPVSAEKPIATAKKEEKAMLWDEPLVAIPAFINTNLNLLKDRDNLQSFWTKLAELETGKRDQVRILHIGDSHLQAGFFSGKLQRFLTARYGNAGRGLVFPYQLAKTNPTADISSASNLSWERQMNISYTHTLPVGIGGFSIKNTSSDFQLRFKIKENYSKEFAFDKITLFTPNTPKTYSVDIAEGWLETKPDGAKHLPLQANSGGSYSVFFDTPRFDFTMFANKTESSQTEFILQGIVLENSRQRGILYNMVGVNGATFGAYNRSVDFVRQVAALEPDLIIFSLGTNEAVDANFKVATMEAQVDKLLTALQQETACDAILLMSANDILIKGAGTEHPLQAAQMLERKAQEYKAAYWDFYALMGGKGSIKTWQTAALAQSDYIHLSPKGYEVQAQLLFDALMK